jgi:hypothetical protein
MFHGCPMLQAGARGIEQRERERERGEERKRNIAA